MYTKLILSFKTLYIESKVCENLIASIYIKANFTLYNTHLTAFSLLMLQKAIKKPYQYCNVTIMIGRSVQLASQLRIANLKFKINYDGVK